MATVYEELTADSTRGSRDGRLVGTAPSDVKHQLDATPPLRAAPGPPPAPPNAQPQASLRGENHSLRSWGGNKSGLGPLVLGLRFSARGLAREPKSPPSGNKTGGELRSIVGPPRSPRATGGKVPQRRSRWGRGALLRWQERPPPTSSISLTPPPPLPGCTRPPSGSPQRSASGFAQGREPLASPGTPLPPSEYSPQRRASPSWGEKRTRPPPGEETGPTFEIIGALLHASRVRGPGLSYPQPKTDNRQQPACGLYQLSAVSSSQRTSTASTSASRSPELSMR